MEEEVRRTTGKRRKERGRKVEEQDKEGDKGDGELRRRTR